MQREASDIKGRWYYTEYTETKYGARDLFPGVKGIALADSTQVTSLRHENHARVERLKYQDRPRSEFYLHPSLP